MKTLPIARGFDLPADAATRRMAILAMSGAGKSNAAVVIAEQMFAVGIPWVAIDPKGDWWGVRARGTGPGMSIPIFGGLHGDVRLEPTSGKLIADLIVTKRLTCVIDVSEFDNRQDMWRFMIDFGEELLRKNRSPMHVFLEEADEILPQKASEKGNLLKCLSTWQRVVKRGRFRGIGTTQITQRSASLNKDTLYQAEALFALRTAGQGDRKAIEGWLSHNAGAAEIVAQLPTLGDGEAFIVSPSWLKIDKRIHFYRRTTFDSGSTPFEVEGSKKRPATLADVDLKAIQKQMAETIEKAAAEDPALLKKKIADLERQMKAAPVPTTLAAHKELTNADRELLRGLARKLDDTRASVEDVSDSTLESITTRVIDVVRKELGSLLTSGIHEREKFLALLKGTKFTRALTLIEDKVRSVPRTIEVPVTPAQLMERNRKTAATVGVNLPVADGRTETGKLGRMERSILAVLANYPSRTIGQIALLSRYAVSGGFKNALTKLRTAGYMVGDNTGDMSITTAGKAVLGTAYEPLPSGADLYRYWLSSPVFGKMERAIMEALWYTPEGLAIQPLASASGYEVSGGFKNALTKLRTAGVMVGANTGIMKLHEDLR